MKKFFPFLLAVILVISLAVPAFAQDNVFYNSVYPHEYTNYVIFTDNAKTHTYLAVSNKPFRHHVYGADRGFRTADEHHTAVFYWQNNHWTYWYEKDDTSALSWDSSSYTRLYHNNDHGSLTAVPYDHFRPYGTECDGSTCPATNAYFDDYCDDCGAPLVMSLRGYPPIDGIWNKSVYPYGLLYSKTNGELTVYFFDNLYTTSDGVDLRFNDGNFEVYNYVDGVWTFERTGRGAVEFPDLDSGQILKLSHDLVYDGSVVMAGDSSFFPVPLWEKVQMVTQGEIPGLLAATAGTMKTLVLCGVGLIALLVVLNLFGKRLPISLR